VGTALVEQPLDSSLSMIPRNGVVCPVPVGVQLCRAVTPTRKWSIQVAQLLTTARAGALSHVGPTGAMGLLIKSVPVRPEGREAAQHHLPAKSGHFAEDRSHRGEQHNQDGLRAGDSGRVPTVSRVPPGEAHFSLGRGTGAGVRTLMAKEACELANGRVVSAASNASALTAELSRAAALARHPLQLST
jgi:hypothetical protein